MRNTLLLIVLAFALAVAAYLFTRPIQESSADRLLPGFAPEKAARVLIQAEDGQVNLLLANGTWTVTDREGYPAEGERVVRLLRTVWELRPVQSLTVREADLPRFELAAPGNASASNKDRVSGGTGTLVAFQDAEGNELGGLILGKRHVRDGQGGFPGMAVGRYVRNSQASTRVDLVTETFDDATPAPQTWLDKEFLKLPKLVSVEFSPAGNGSQGWQLFRENEQWKLSGAKKGEILDTSKVGLLTSSLSGLSFDDLGPAEFEPSARLTLVTEEGIRWNLKIGSSESGEVPVKITAEILPEAPEGTSFQAYQRFLNRSFLVPGFILDSLTIAREQLLLQPEPTPTPSPTPSKPARRR